MKTKSQNARLRLHKECQLVRAIKVRLRSTKHPEKKEKEVKKK